MDCLARIADLIDPDALSVVLGPVRRVREESMHSIGFTMATHRRVVVELDDGREESFVLKQTSPSTDWTAIRTRDTRGREAAILEEPRLAAMWTCVASPYVACARESAGIGLLMRDLSPYLLPDVRAPLDVDQELSFLGTLARLHARFWDFGDAPACLARARDYVEFIGPRQLAEVTSLDAVPAHLRKQIADGWASVARRVPPSVMTLLELPTADVVQRFLPGPHTLVHGDAKVANFAIDRATSTVWAFDWAMAGCAPAGVDLGWYLCVNGSRIAESKEAALARYRGRLDAARGVAMSDDEWSAVESGAVVCGALMGLWSKAMLVEARAANADREWSWWVDRLASLAGAGVG